MKILCVCAGGNSRSVQMGFLLKAEGHEILSMGVEHATPGTQEMLFNWADRVILFDKGYKDRIPENIRISKLRIWDVGHDRFFAGVHPDLVKIYNEQRKDIEL